MESNGARLLVEAMKLERAKYLFGMSATATLPVLDDICDTPQITYVQSQHVQGAIYMANGYARATGDVSFCLVGPGPGTTNCQSGMAQAFYTFVPSILIAIDDTTEHYGLGAYLHHGLDSVAVMKPVTKLSLRAERAARLAELMRMASRVALSPRAELKQAFTGRSDLYYRLMQLRYLKFVKRCPTGRSAGDVPEYGWTLSPEYAAKVWR